MQRTITQIARKSLATLTMSALTLGTFGFALAASAPIAFASTTPTTNSATSISSSNATLNGTNGDTAASDSSFWVSTSTFATTPSSPLPAGVYSTPALGPVNASTTFSGSLSSVSGLLPITPGTTYFVAAWVDVAGTWTPGPVESFTTTSAPTITSVSPSSGSTSGGTAITITGTGFANGAAVKVGGTSATSVVVVNSTSITATTPAGTAGPQDVVVTNTDAGTVTSTGGFTYTALAGTAPTTLAATGITSSDATLNGMNGTSDAAHSSFWVSTSTFPTTSTTLPSGVFSTPDLGAVSSSTAFSAALSSVSGLLPITATTTYYFAAWTEVGGIWTPGAVLQFNTSGVVTPTAPVVSSVASTTGAIAGGDTVTITGSGFTGATAVHFGTLAATGVTVVNDTSITAISPATTTPGVVDVTVTTPLGTSATSSADHFTYALTGTVTGTGVLNVNSITSVKTNATADGSFANGWIYTFNITMPTNEPNLSMQFADWTGAGTIPAGGNMQISSAQANNSGSC